MSQTADGAIIVASTDSWTALENAINNYSGEFSDSADYWILIEGHEMPSSRRDFVGGLVSNKIADLADGMGDGKLSLVPGQEEILADVLDELRNEMSLSNRQKRAFDEIEQQL